MTLQIGSLLKNRYRIQRVLARGGMGAIYAAFDESLSVQVALKENLFETEDSTRQFRREATILASLRHTNLPRVTDHFVFPDGQYLVMDFIEGEDLKDRIQNGVLSEEEVVLVGIAICDALRYMHSRKPPIVHRDIKPGNIKITPNGEIFLVDFGIAKISQPGQGTTVGAQSLTPGFAPPEQYGQGTDARTDIYSLGATLYLALTGLVPANGLARMMQQETLVPIRQVNPRISANLARVIEKALEVRKEDRYQSADEFLQELMAAHQGARTKRDSMGSARIDPAPTLSTIDAARPSKPVPGPTGSPGSTSVPVKKKRSKATGFIIAGLAISLVCILSLVAVFSFNLIPGMGLAQLTNPSATPPAPTSTAEPQQSDTPQPAAESPTPGATEVIPAVVESSPTEEPSPEPELSPTSAATPTGGGTGQILFVSDRTGKPQLFIIHADGSNLQQITNEADGACQPDWSPDGTRIIFVSPCRIQDVINPQAETYRGSTLFIINADGTGRYPMVSFPGGDFDPAWSPDGSQIAFTTYRDNLSATDLNLYLYNLEEKSVTALTQDLNSDRRPVWSPDGEQIAFQRQPQGGSIQIHIMQKDGSSIAVFSDPELTNSFMPDWGIGDSIVFSRGNPFPAPIARPLSPRNAQEIQLSNDPAWDIDFSADGYWLVFERVEFQADGSRNHDIFLMPYISGASATQLTDDPARDYQPVWKPLGLSGN